MAVPQRIVIFSLDTQLYGVPLASVERVVRMVEITHMPGLPKFVRGVINVQGNIMSALDLRCRFGLPERPVQLSDQLIIMNTPAGQSLAIMVDGTGGVREYHDRDLAQATDLLPDSPFLTGVAKFPDGIVLIQEPDRLLSQAEYELLGETTDK